MDIAFYFVEAIDTPPSTKDSSTAAWIQQKCIMPVGSLNVIKCILVDTQACDKDSVIYSSNKGGSDRLVLTVI